MGLVSCAVIIDTVPILIKQCVAAPGGNEVSAIGKGISW